MILVSVISAALFLFFAVAIKNLKWYGLIAGYNTAKADYKNNMDIEKIANLMGSVFYIIAGLWILNLLLYHFKIDNTGLVGICSTLAGITFVVIKSQVYDKNPGQKLRLGIAVVLMALICGVVAFLLYYGAKAPKINFSKDKMTITGIYGIDIPYSDISKYYLKDTIPKIKSKTNGFDFGAILKGHFAVEGLADTRLFLQTKKPPFLYIHTKKETVIMNSNNENLTKQWFLKVNIQMKLNSTVQQKKSLIKK